MEMKTLKDTVHTRKEILSDFWPAAIGSHGEKEIRLSVFTTNSQGVLKQLLHVASSSLMSGWQNDSTNLTHILQTILAQTITQPLIEICSKSCLVVGNPSEIALINGCPSITDQLLEQPPSLE
jgi:hypothetical protein